MEHKESGTDENKMNVEGKQEFERQKQLLEDVQKQIRAITQLITEESQRLNQLQNAMTEKIEQIHTFIQCHPLHEMNEEEGFEEEDEDSWSDSDIIWDCPINENGKTNEEKEEKKPKLPNTD